MKRLIKLLILSLIFNMANVGLTNSYFSARANVEGNLVSAGCWVAPTTPQLIYPEDEYLAGLGSDWLVNPYMDWSDSSTTCPGGVISYIYESYRDAELSSLAYRSGVLLNSMIPAPGTPDGNYYWRVRAFDGWNWSAWSEVWLLIVDRTAPVPISTPTPTPTPEPGRVVINEVYYDTIGTEYLEEWVELYNAGPGTVDLSGWKLTDLEGTFVILPGITIIADRFLVIARNQTGFFNLYGFNPDISGLNLSLANDRDEIILRTPDDVDIDAVVYEGGSYGSITPHPGVVSGHSIARSPKGADTDDCSVDFVDLAIPNPGTNPHPPVPVPTPTPEAVPTVVPTLSPTLEFSLRGDKKAVSFTVENISSFNKLSYEIIYDSDNGEKGIAGSVDLTGENTFSRSDLLLGSCSGIEGKVCTYDEGITKLHLKITLVSGGVETILGKEIGY